MPLAVLGVRCTETAVSAIDFLPSGTPLIAPRNVMAAQVCAALQAYLHDPGCRFDLARATSGTPFQNRVWAAIASIPCGKTLTYGELAQQVGSGARAVANACGVNPFPVVIPCHRVVAAHGLGGFMQCSTPSALAIKRWLLDHERSASGVA